MTAEPLDISASLDWVEDLPRPKWDLITTWVETHVGPGERHAAWAALARQWLEKLGPALGSDYRLEESEHVLLLVTQMKAPTSVLLPFAEECRHIILETLPGVTDFGAPGKQVILAFRRAADYYRYIAPYYPEGRHGESGGVQIRQGYPHIAMWNPILDALQQILAHEMTHFGLSGLCLPQWIEEGLAQMFEHDMTGRALLVVDGKMVRRQRGYWGKHGLDQFWRGKSFYLPGKVQALSYQLAEILIRLLVEDNRPRWFGWDKRPQRRFFTFLRGANACDCGEAAARAHLGSGLAEVAARFLGPGEWGPSVLRSDEPSPTIGTPATRSTIGMPGAVHRLLLVGN